MASHLLSKKCTLVCHTSSPNSDTRAGVKSIIFHPVADLRMPPKIRLWCFFFFFGGGGEIHPKTLQKTTPSLFFNKKMPNAHPQKKTHTTKKKIITRRTQLKLWKKISSWDTSEVSELPPALGSCGGFQTLGVGAQKKYSRENMPWINSRIPWLLRFSRSNYTIDQQNSSAKVILIEEEISHSIIFVKISSISSFDSWVWVINSPCHPSPRPSSKTLRAVWERPWGVDGSTFTWWQLVDVL